MKKSIEKVTCLFWEPFLHIWQETDLNSYGHLSRSKTFCQVCKISTLNECLQHLSLLPHNDTLPGCFLHWLFEVPRDHPPHTHLLLLKKKILFWRLIRLSRIEGWRFSLVVSILAQARQLLGHSPLGIVPSTPSIDAHTWSTGCRLPCPSAHMAWCPLTSWLDPCP